MKRISLLYSLLLVFALFISEASGQNSQSYLNDVGSTSYGINIPVENGFINISNGNLHLEFPLASHPQRGALSLSERLTYDSRIWEFSPFGSHGSYHWWPYNVPGTTTSSAGWQFIRGNEVGSVTYSFIGSYTYNCPGSNGDESDPDQGTTIQQYINYVEPNGTSHPTNAVMTTQEDDGGGTAFGDGCSYSQSVNAGSATDGSGYSIQDDGSGNPLVTDNNRTEVYPQIIDRYGNFFSADSQGNLMDTIGRVPIIVTQNGNVTYYDVLAPNGPISNNGTRIRYTVTTASIQVSTQFNQSDVYDWNGPYLTPVQSIVLPDGSQYSFSYDSYGGLASMTLPTGGVIQYGYANFVDSSNTANRWLTSRTVGSNPAMTFTPSVVTTCANYSTGCVEQVTVHKPSGDETAYQLTLNNGAWNTAAKVYSGTATAGTQLLQTTNVNSYTLPCNAPGCYSANYLAQSLTTTTLFAGGNPSVSSQTQSTYNGTVGKIGSVQEWDYALASSVNASNAPTLTPTRETDYAYSATDLLQVKVLDSSGAIAGLTGYGYTSNATATSGIQQHGTQNAGGPYLQTVTHWLNTGGYSTTTYGMYDTGQVQTIQDPNQNPNTTIAYQCQGSLPNTVTNPLSQVTTYGYDCTSGAITSVQDPNDLATQRNGTVYAYESVAGRQYTVTAADGGVTTYTYPSANEVDTAVTATPSPTITTADIADSFGRAYRHTVGGVSNETTYDANGRQYCVTTPHVPGQTNSTDGTTCITSYDGLDRPLTQTNPDSSTRTWTYSGNVTTSSDERGIGWTRTSDAFGHLTKVVEPGPAGALSTTYVYDGLGNAQSVTQTGLASNGESSRVRTFTHDSMARLTCASHPESSSNSCPSGLSTSIPSGVTSYTYDLAGNVHTLTDARGITTTYSYDALNRLTHKAYSDATPSAQFDYDQAGSWNGVPRSNTIGRLWHTAVGANTSHWDERIYSYDAAGRVQQVLDAPPAVAGTSFYTVTAQYDLAGNMTGLTYPDGRTVGQGFDASGRMSAVNYASWNGTLMNQGYYSVPSGSGYDPTGHLANGSFGNTIPMSASYDNRGRVQSLSYGPSSALRWSKQYTWTPNGNLQTITDPILGVQRQFGYDTLNRLNVAQDIITNSSAPGGTSGGDGTGGTPVSGPTTLPGSSGAAPWWTNPDDSNLLPDPNGSNWSGSAVNTALNTVAAPDGSITATTVTASAGSGDSYLAIGVPSPALYDGETIHESVWLRTANGTQTINLYIVDVGANGWGVPGWQQIQVTPTWQQFQVSGALQNGLSALIFQLGGGGSFTNGQSIYMWNPMMEDAGTAGGSTTNFLLYSQRVSAYSWGLQATSTVDNSATAPDGTQTASMVTANGGSSDSWIVNDMKNPSILSNASVTGSVWLRVPSGSQNILLTLIETNSQTLGAKTVTLTTDWRRFQVSGTTQNALSELQLQIGGANTFINGQSIQVWGAQMELASTDGPYVPTGGVPVTQGSGLSNLLPYSQQPTSSSWGSSAVQSNTSGLTAPDGSPTGSEITANGDTYIVDFVPNPELYDGATLTGSIYLRVPSGSRTIGLYFFADAANGRTYFGAASVTLTTTWQRFQITGTVPSAVYDLGLQVGGGETFMSGQAVDIWGAQVELGSTAGPYIATSALPILTERRYTNILPASQSVNSPAWASNQVAVSTNADTAPDGTTTAASITSVSGANDSYVLNLVMNPSLYDQETVTASVYLRSMTGPRSIDLFLMSFVGGNRTLIEQTVTLSAAWQRFSVTGTLPNGQTALWFVVGAGNSFTSGESIELWGAQLVIGSSAGPYLGSTDGTVTSIATGQPATLVQNGLNLAYAYDSFGNLLQNGSFQSSYTAANQMFGYAYDAAGNLLSDGVNTMAWDAESRMASATGTTYVYGAEGERVEKQGSGVTDIVYFAGRPIARYAAGQWTDLVYGPTGLLAEVPGTQNASPTYTVSDHLGSTVGSLLADGTFVNPLDYTPFGQRFSGTTADPYQYTGLERDPESGFDHADARQYSSTTGRWNSPDPYDGSMNFTNPQSLNRYVYVGNNPLNSVDPSGLCGESLEGPGEDNDDGDESTISDILGCIKDLFTGSLFYHPPFTGTTAKRPGAIWDEHGGFQPHADILGVLGLPSDSECEFGACNFQQGGGPPGGAASDLLYWGAGYVLNGLNDLIFTPGNRPAPRRYFGTYYCGPGGEGPRGGLVNGACAAHDDCFRNARINADGNTNKSIYWSAAQIGLAKGCNQTLYNTLKGSDAPGATLIQAWLLWGDRYGYLRPGTAVTP